MPSSVSVHVNDLGREVRDLATKKAAKKKKK
jgi:hypothetical protein